MYALVVTLAMLLRLINCRFIIIIIIILNLLRSKNMEQPAVSNRLEFCYV